MYKKFPDLLKNINLYTQEAQQTPSRINAQKSTNRYAMVKTVTSKGQNLESKRNDLSLTSEPP